MSGSSSFTVPGRPIPAERMTQRSKFSDRAQRYLKYKALVGWRAKQAHIQMTNGPVTVAMLFYFSNNRLPDVDNLVKAILDGLNKVAWKDDRQVARIEAERIMDTVERAEIVITPYVSEREEE